MSALRHRTMALFAAAVCAVGAAAITLLATATPSADEAAETARAWQADMVGAINPLLVAYEQQTGVPRDLWHDGPIDAGCPSDSARARQSYHFAIPTTARTHGRAVDDALQTLIDFIVEVPSRPRDHYAGATLTSTANDGASFHEVLEFRRDGYTLTLVVHAAPGERPHQLVLVVDAYSPCV